MARWRADGRWIELPGWRFYRQVIRLGLFLRERLRVAPGDRVLIASPLRAERLVAEWATVTIGAVAVPVDGGFDDDLGVLARAAAPKAAFVAGPAAAHRVRETAGGVAADAIVTFDSGSLPTGARTWTEVLDLGGTLDTAERATSFRAQADALTPTMPALGYVGASESSPAKVVTHAEVVEGLRAFWARVPPRTGDIAYVSSGGRRTSVCLPAWAFVADGQTSTAFGTPGREAAETAELHPQLIVGPSDIGELAASWTDHPPEQTVASPLAGRMPVVGSVVRRLLRRKLGPEGPRGIREIMTFDAALVGNNARRLQ